MRFWVVADQRRCGLRSVSDAGRRRAHNPRKCRAIGSGAPICIVDGSRRAAYTSIDPTYTPQTKGWL